MSNTASKRGRKRKPFVTSWGEAINGLYHRPDGRWKVVDTGYLFTESDEREAVRRFLQLTQPTGKTLDLPVDPAKEEPAENLAQLRGNIVPPSLLVPPPSKQLPIQIGMDENGNVTFSRQVDELAFYAAVRNVLLEKREYVAKMTGIEKLVWLDGIEKPKPSPTLAAVGKAYFDRNDVSEKELQKCEASWKLFKRVTGAETLKDLTPESVAKYGQHVEKLGLAPKSVAHHYNRMKTVLGNFLHTGKDIDATRRALDCCQVLKTPSAVSLDPHPIARSVFTKLLDVATAEEKALLLVALNCCFYPIDIARLEWDHLDLERGVFHQKRGKTKVARAAVLMGRTLEALKEVPRCEDDNRVFHTALSGRPKSHTDNTTRKLFASLRKRAGLGDDIQFADIRDGSFTAAVAGEGVEFQHARVLAGHRSGIADAYVLRNPAMTRKACEAVEKHYFG